MAKSTKVAKPKTAVEPIIEETKELIIEQPKEVEPVIDTPVIEEAKVEEPKAIETVTEDLSIEQKILDFIKSREDGVIRMNEFLKSLYGIPKVNEPATWLQKGESKSLRYTLEKMQADGLIKMANDNYKQLGQFYHAGEQQETKHYNLSDTEILVQK